MRVEIQIKSSNLPWAKKGQTSKSIDLQNVFSDFWTSKVRELTVPGQCDRSYTSLLISDRKAQRLFPLEIIVVL